MSKKEKKEKKYNLKSYPYLNMIIDDLPTDDIRKKYNIKTLIKSYDGKIQEEINAGNSNAKPTNNLHIMFELCKKYKLTINIEKRRCDNYYIENERLKDEISRLNEKYASHIKEDKDINRYKMDAIWGV
tara:strand:- start:829 stop:1215 length:387 start_codon:yes stop_codon:yes gene_type:complete